MEPVLRLEDESRALAVCATSDALAAVSIPRVGPQLVGQS